MQTAQAAMLPDGRRLHLHHGPIDLIVEAWGDGREGAYRLACARFENLLQELVDELPTLRSAFELSYMFEGVVARRMHDAVSPFSDQFVTPMAAVAGAVADEILSVMVSAGGLEKAYVNNGGDAAFYLTGEERIEAALTPPLSGKVTVSAMATYRGIATSGWRGRSHSLGIADAVSVVAETAAAADAAATMIANAVDLPGHPAITRQPACELAPDSDLGARAVTIDVGILSAQEIERALARGAGFADELCTGAHIAGAVLVLNNELRQVGATESLQVKQRTAIDA